MIIVKIGDIFESKAQTLVNTVNCVGVMGKGIAQLFKKNYPEMFLDYEGRCKLNQVHPGEPYLYKDILGTSILNFPTKDHWRSPALLINVVRGLEIFIKKYKEWGVKSVAFPPLGCGNGGLEWEIVGPIMYQKLSQLEIPVEIYAPYGISTRLISKDFLENVVQTSDPNSNQISGKNNKPINPYWMTILEVIDQLLKNPRKIPIGRTIFQKICYVLTERGVKTGFKFARGSYGPFSNDVKIAINILANSNLIHEKQLGRMTTLEIGKEYYNIRNKYVPQIERSKKEIEKTVDLFCRIGSTEQAEEAATVIFALNQLKQEGQEREISEQELLDFVIEWKKVWNNSQKRSKLVSTIRNLEMLNWMSLKYSNSLPLHED